MTNVGTRALVAPTRLRVPAVTPETVRRSTLVEKVIGRRPITLVSAPAGSGKTTAVADWAHAAIAAGERLAWLSLEERDDHPYEFWSALVTALAAASAPAAAGRLDALSPPKQGLERGFVLALADTLASDADLRWLVLDDLHLIRHPDVVAGVDLLLASLTDQVGVVVVGRFDPPVSVARWRAEGRLVEAHTADLAFSTAEARELFDRLGSEVSGDDLERIVDRTEGWAVGLRLAAASVGDRLTARRTDPRADQRAIEDYLTSEIVDALPDGVDEFLLATCAPAQLSIDLAAHLSGRADAGAVLDRLCRANALVVQSGSSAWYRYHALLRDYFLTELGRRDVGAPARQHAIVARWFADRGDPAIALEHAQASGDRELIETLLAEHGLRLVLSGQAQLVAAVAASTPAGAVPDLRVATVVALAALDRTDLVAADEWLAAARRAAPVDDPLLAPQLASAQVQRALLEGDVAAAVATSGILDVGVTGVADVDLMMLTYRAPARMRFGDYAGAVADLEQALRLSRARGYDEFVLLALSQLAGMSGAQCDFEASSSWSAQAISFAAQRGWSTSPRVAYAHLLAAWTGFQTGDLEAQADHAERGVQVLEGINNVEVEVGVLSMHALARFENATGHERLEAAARFHGIWEDARTAHVSPALAALAVFEEIRLALAVGQSTWAEEAARRAEERAPGSGDAATMRAHVLAAHGRTQVALDVLRPVLTGDLPLEVPTNTVQANVLAAVLESLLGREQRAFAALRRALEWAAPNGYVRPFINSWSSVRPLLIEHRSRFGPAEEFVTRLLRDLPVLGEAPPLASSALTSREREVLHDLASARTLRAIADSQGVSVNTIKTHVSAVYAKLGATTRTEALDEARQRGLI